MYNVVISEVYDDYKRASVSSQSWLFKTEFEADQWICFFYLKELSDRDMILELDDQERDLLDKKEFNAFNEKMEDRDWSGEYVMEPLNILKQKLEDFHVISEKDSSKMTELIDYVTKEEE
jgi:hypothetical protein